MCEFLQCGSEFQDIFDVDHFITSLRDEVRILKELPPRLKERVELGRVPSMPPISWSDISYYLYQVSLPFSLKHETLTMPVHDSFLRRTVIFNVCTDSPFDTKA